MQEATDTAPRTRTLEAPSSGEPLRMEAASLSDVGRTRTENQDACGEVFDAAGNRLLIVADGMGGHAGGSTASRICIETACREFRESSAPLDERLRLAIQQANADVFEVASENHELAGMGTTAVAIALEPSGQAWVGWVGDSRAYRMRHGELAPITDDHSWVAEAVRMGAIRPEEAETHPRKNQLLRSVGADPTVEVDVRPVEVRSGDRYLICSDGLWGEVSAPEIAAVLGYDTPSSATRKLVDRANENGGPDNITVQILAVGEPESVPAAAATAAGEAKAALPIRLIGAAALVAVCLVGFVGYALVYGGGGFPDRVAEVDAPEPVEIAAVEAEVEAESQVEATGEIAEEVAEATAERPAVASAPAEIAAVPEPVAPAEVEPPVVGPAVPEPTGVAPPDSLAPVASGTLQERADFPRPPPEPALSATQVEAEVEGFLGGWSRSVMDKDFAAYDQLGLPASRKQFERDYGKREELSMSFDLLESSPQADGTVKARVRMSYGYATNLGRKELQTEYKIRLRKSPQGMRYVGGY